MARYRKKPVVIEAVKFVGDNYDELATFGQLDVWVERAEYSEFIVLETLEGEMKAKVGDWIIKGVVGELYPCRADVFEATYELVDET